MKYKGKKLYHYCQHCGKKHETKFMAEYCFELDMKHIENEKGQKRNINMPKGL